MKYYFALVSSQTASGSYVANVFVTVAMSPLTVAVVKYKKKHPLAKCRPSLSSVTQLLVA